MEVLTFEICGLGEMQKQNGQVQSNFMGEKVA
jgi:hypothetical protein